jgi:molybdenum cofactor synthesis domain-containing protein
VSLKVFAERCGAMVSVLPLVADDLESLKKAIEKAAQRSDLLILSGGVSVGDYDFTKPALRELGAEIFFERVALRPGKPAVFAKLNDCFIFGLPGNPVSVAVTFFLFVRKTILQMQGAADRNLQEGFAVLTKNAKGAKERDSYLPAKIGFNEKAQISAEPIKWGGSSDFVAFSKADCLIHVPQGKIFESGATVKFVYLP